MKKVTCIKVFGLNMARMCYSKEKIKPQIHLSGSKSHVDPLGSMLRLTLQIVNLRFTFS